MIVIAFLPDIAHQPHLLARLTVGRKETGTINILIQQRIAPAQHRQQ